MALISAACGGSHKSPPVRIAVGGQAQIVYLPATLAQQLGFYKDEGLDVALQDFPGGSKALEAVLGGSADVVCGFYDHTIQMAAEGREMKSFITMVRYPGLVLAVSPAASKKIGAIEDLKGAIAGVTSPGSSTHFFINYLLSKHGLTPGDISVTGIGAAAAAVAAVERGKVDAAVVTDPALAQIQKRNPNIVILADTRTAQGVKEAFGAGSYPAAVLYSSAKWIAQNPDATRRLARAMQHTLRWVQEHSPEEIMQKMPESYRGGDPAVYLEALQHSMAMFSSDGIMSPEGPEAVRKVLSFSVEKIRNAGIDLPKTYTNEFVQK